MKDYFKIKNQKSDERAKLYIYDQIGKDWWSDEGVSDKDVIAWLADAGGKPLDVHINSVGGNVYEGIAICNALRNYENDVTIYIDGIAASIASVIACASDDVRINSGATLMIHGVSGGFYAYGGEEDIKDAADRYIAAMKSCKESIIDIYESKTGLSRDDLSALMDTDTYLSADEAVAKGFCNEVLNKKPDKSVENSLQAQMKSYPNTKLQAVVNRLFSAPPSANAEPESVKPIINQGASTMPKTEAELRAELMAELKAKEDKRKSDIKAIFGDKQQDLMNQCLLDQECSPEAAKDKLLENLLNAPAPTNSQSVGGFNVVEDQSDKKIKAIAQAWDDRRTGKFDATNEMRGATMHTAIANIAQKHGKSTLGFSGEQMYNLLTSDMQVSSEFSVLLSDNLNKSVLQGYELADVVWRKICSVGSFNDFREHELHSLGVIGELPLKSAENAEYNQIKLPDSEAQTYAPQERGGIIMLSRKLLINNDLDNLETQARDAGHAGAFTIENLVFKYLFDNPTLKDGKKLFSTGHGNLLTASAPTEASLLAMQALFDEQKAPGSKDAYLHLAAKLALADRAALGLIKGLNTRETGKEAKQTIGMFADDAFIFSQRMKDKGVYFFADPNTAPVLKVGFLNGSQVPTVTTEEDFNSGAMKWRLQLDCGVGAVNYRGAVFMPYAAPEEPTTEV